MTTLELTYTLPANHIIQLPDDIPAGTKVRIVVDDITTTKELADFLAWQESMNNQKKSPSENALAYLNGLQDRLNQMPRLFASTEEVEAHIQALRHDWDDE